jgi:hypothetical protein
MNMQNVIYVEGVSHRGMLKVEVVVAIKFAAGRSQGREKQCGE